MVALTFALVSVGSDEVVSEEAISSFSDSSEPFPVRSDDSGENSIEKCASGLFGDCG